MSLARAASAFIERRPNATTVAAAMARGAAGDACAQRAEDHGTWDARRCATFMAWSTGVAFALDRYVYSHLFARWWPPVWKSNLRHVRRLLDSVAVSVPHRSTEPARPCRRREMT